MSNFQKGQKKPVNSPPYVYQVRMVAVLTWLFQGPGHVRRNYEKLAVLFICLSNQHDSKCVRKLRPSRKSKIFFLKKFDLTRPQSLCFSKVFEENWGKKTIINYTKTMNFTSFLKRLENVSMLRLSDDNFYFHEKFKY